MMNERGFTLAELLVATAILGMIMAAIVTLQHQGQSAYLTGAARVEAQQNARVALELMSRELRTARSITAVGATCNDATTGTNDVTFETWDAPTASWVIARYRLNGATLERTYNGVTTGLIGGVLQLGVVCYRADGTTTTNVAADVRSIRLTIRTQPEDVVVSYGPSKQTIKEEAQIGLRNVI